MKMRTLAVFIMLNVMHAGVTRLYSGQKEKLSAAEVLEKVQEAYSSIDDASAGFTQTVSLKYREN